MGSEYNIDQPRLMKDYIPRPAPEPTVSDH